MRKTSKVIALFLVLLMAFSVLITGCGNSTKSDQSKTSENSSAQNKTETTSQPVTLDIFQFKVEIKDALQNAINTYMKENPNVKINLETVGGGQDYGAALKAKFNSGSEPAIYNVGGPQDVATWKPKLADLSDTKAAKAALPGTLTGVTQDGKIYGLPFDLEGYGLIYNKQIFSKAGIDPSSIKTFDALVNAVKTLDSKKKELGIEAVFAFPAKETWVTGLHLSNAFLSPEFDGDVMKAFNSKTVEFKYGDAMKQMIDLQNKYSVQPTASLDYSTQVEKLFGTGKVAMIQQGNWVYPTLESLDKNFAQNDIGMLPYPVPGYKEDSYPEGVPMYWAVNSDKPADVQKAAKDFLDWLYTSDEGKQIVTQQFKFVPAYTGYNSNSISDPLGMQLFVAASQGKTYGWVFMGYPNNWGMNVLGADIQLYVNGSLTWDKVISHAKQAWADARK
ncbi:MAG TPA: carbohydrate ABC transporter substrate-binding protein [Thermoanaerobacterium sp.]|nr:carbohydrate ABC transporter substrate-binding protein [Thermoanaerobacterium sp.]